MLLFSVIFLCLLLATSLILWAVWLLGETEDVLNDDDELKIW